MTKEEAINAAQSYARRYRPMSGEPIDAYLVDEDVISDVPEYKHRKGYWAVRFRGAAFDGPPFDKFWVHDRTGRVSIAGITWLQWFMWPLHLLCVWLNSRRNR